MFLTRGPHKRKRSPLCVIIAVIMIVIVTVTVIVQILLLLIIITIMITIIITIKEIIIARAPVHRCIAPNTW